MSRSSRLPALPSPYPRSRDQQSRPVRSSGSIRTPAVAPGSPSALPPISDIFPHTHHLVITTPKHVYSWTTDGVTHLFTSGSEGIVAAKKAKDGSGILAIADSQVVVLHDTRRKMDESYRLKGAEGQVRLLGYADESKSLLFTTSLQNSVQTYSLAQSKLLLPAQDHPSPPTILALSSPAQLLLSASVNPPTIHLKNLTLGTPPLNLRPNCSSSAVVVASFHPDRANVFLLAFADGTLAMYDATAMFRGDEHQAKSGVSAGRRKSPEVSVIRNLHAAGMTTAPADPNGVLDGAALGGYDQGTGTVSVGSKALGITAASFVPGYRARAISAGADGKCCLVDFEGGGKGKAKLIKSWHLQAPATSMSILPMNERPSSAYRSETPSFKDSARSTPSTPFARRQCIVAIGRVDGKVLLYNAMGRLLAEQTINPGGGRIIEVDWVPALEDVTKRRGGRERTQRQMLSPFKTPSKPKQPATGQSRLTTGPRSGVGQNTTPRRQVKSRRKSLGSLLAAGRQVQEQVVDVHDGNDSGGDSASEPMTAVKVTQGIGGQSDGTVDSADGWSGNDGPEPVTSDYMSLFSPVKRWAQPVETISKSPSPCETDYPEKLEGGLSADLQGLEIGETELDRGDEPRLRPSHRRKDSTCRPVIPARHTSRRSRRISIRRTHASHEKKNSVSLDGAKILADLRKVSNNGPDSNNRNLSLFAPYMQKNLVKDDSTAPLKPDVPAYGVRESHEPVMKPEESSRTETGDFADIWLTEAEGENAHPPRSTRKRGKTYSGPKPEHRRTVTFDSPAFHSSFSIHEDQEFTSTILSPVSPGRRGHLTESTPNIQSPAKTQYDSARHPTCCSQLEAEVARLRADMHEMKLEMERQRSLFESLIRNGQAYISIPDSSLLHEPMLV
ncbi:hypothetical protein L228DRAFT_259463 [Xylona heveae TC161]|uniref:WD40 repeat-like protein n=1 Tax=Xylona heveae (strain CBS 132557 / TC161) TaxID=1328760 RepID=A0A165I197_XYLHT|nr:hypothetical protein L228DRAFT_259463 [Xylona heveae TC161]KZF24213.1 hypothetical protein L228DRAFT_259463 [Xylona heveae TC161]